MTNKPLQFYLTFSLIQKPIFTTSGSTVMTENRRVTSYGNRHDNVQCTKTGTPMNPVEGLRTVWRCCSKNLLTRNILGCGMIKYVVMETILFVNKGSVIICRLLESIRESILFVCLPVFVKKIQNFVSVFEVSFYTFDTLKRKTIC